MLTDQSSVSAKELQESGNHFCPLSSDNNVSTTLLTLPREQVSPKPHKASIHHWNENTDSEQMPSPLVRGRKNAHCRLVGQGTSLKMVSILIGIFVRPVI